MIYFLRLFTIYINLQRTSFIPNVMMAFIRNLEIIYNTIVQTSKILNSRWFEFTRISQNRSWKNKTKNGLFLFFHVKKILACVIIRETRVILRFYWYHDNVFWFLFYLSCKTFCLILTNIYIHIETSRVSSQ